MRRFAHPNLGRLVQPRHASSLASTAGEGWLWAADNDCFQGLDITRYVAMLDALQVVAGTRYVDGVLVDEREARSRLLFVTVPDVVGDAMATARQFEAWWSAPARRGLPLALVAQDGLEHLGRWLGLAWPRINALFVGGTTEWKLGPAAEALVREAKARGKWVHMGRVNGAGRAAYAATIGCDSFDGTGAALFTNLLLPTYIAWAQAPRPSRLFVP
jgi:hypothetical protein